MCDELIGGLIGGLCGALCEACGPFLAGLAECMFKLVSVGCSQMIRLACWCSFWNSGNWNNSHGFDGCFYIALALILAAVVIGTLAMGIYALAQYVQDANPAVAAGVACALLDQTITGMSFSAFPVTFGRNKAMSVLGAVPSLPITVYNRCFNNNKGSAKFYVDGKLAAYTKIDQNLYSCTGLMTHQFEYVANSLRVLNADNSLFASFDKVPSTGSATAFRDSGNNIVATLAPHPSGSGFVFQIVQSSSPAASPLLLLAAAAFAQFTSSSNDECNGFVLAGGIVDIILLSLLVAYAAYAALQFYRKRGSITAKFYEPNAPQSNAAEDFQASAAKYGRNDWAAEEYRRERTAAADAAAAAAAAAVLHPAPHHGALPTHPPHVAAAPGDIAVPIRFDDAPSGFQTQPVAQHNFQTSAFHPSTSPVGPPYFPPSPAPAPSPPSFMTYWEGQDLRDKLAPVGYMKLKRYLTLNNVNCGNTLLKDELITLAIIHRERIDFSPLIADA